MADEQKTCAYRLPFDAECRRMTFKTDCDGKTVSDVRASSVPEDAQPVGCGA